MVVNLGQASNYFNATPGSTITVTKFSSNQLQTAFGTLNGLKWAVCGGVFSGDGGDPSIPNTTLWIVRPRVDPAVQTTPWLRRSAFSQSTTVNKIDEFGRNTRSYSDSNPADPIRNTATVVIEPAGNPFSYGLIIGPQGNLSGNFQGNIENNTGDNFTQPTRSDLYELRPSTVSLPGVYLGFFEFDPAGTLTFHAAGGQPPPPPPRPHIEGVTRAGTLTRISFTTTNDAAVSYRLLYTNTAGLGSSVTNWPRGMVTVTGNGTVRTLDDDSSDADRIYGVIAIHDDFQMSCRRRNWYCGIIST